MNKHMIKSFTLLAAMLLIAPASSYAADKADIYSPDQFNNVTITNAEGQKVIFPTTEDMHSGSDVKGDMPHKIHWNDGGEYSGPYGSMDKLVVDESDEFIMTPTKSDWNKFGHRMDYEGLEIDINSSLHPRAYIYGDGIECAGFIKNGVWVKGSKWISCTYDMGSYMPSLKDRINLDDCNIYIFGRKVTLQDDGNKAWLTGAAGRVTLHADKGKGKSRYYLYGGKCTINKENDGLLSIKPGIRITDKVSKTVTNLYLRPSNRGKNLILTWNRVKGANGYNVYQYDRVKNEYVLLDERFGQGCNYYNIPMAEVDKNKGYKFYIKALRWDESYRTILKTIDTSYAVWAVSDGNPKGNVSEVRTNRKTINSKVGKKIKFKATVRTNNGKKPLSTTIRWFTSNKKLVKLNRKTGQATFLKKGKCYIWAKAHNGKNSEKITVVIE